MTPFSSMPGQFLQIFGYKVFHKKSLYISAFIVVPYGPYTTQWHPDNCTLRWSSASLCSAAGKLSVNVVPHSLLTHSIGISVPVQNHISKSHPSWWSTGGTIRLHLYSVSFMLFALLSGNAVTTALIFCISDCFWYSALCFHLSRHHSSVLVEQYGDDYSICRVIVDCRWCSIPPQPSVKNLHQRFIVVNPTALVPHTSMSAVWISQLIFPRNTSVRLYARCSKLVIWPDGTDLFLFSLSDMVTLHKPHDCYVSKSSQNYKEYNEHVFSDRSHRLCFVICCGPLLLGQWRVFIHNPTGILRSSSILGYQHCGRRVCRNMSWKNSADLQGPWVDNNGVCYWDILEWASHPPNNFWSWSPDLIFLENTELHLFHAALLWSYS